MTNLLFLLNKTQSRNTKQIWNDPLYTHGINIKLIHSQEEGSSRRKSLYANTNNQIIFVTNGKYTVKTRWKHLKAHKNMEVQRQQKDSYGTACHWVFVIFITSEVFLLWTHNIEQSCSYFYNITGQGLHLKYMVFILILIHTTLQLVVEFQGWFPKQILNC